MKMKKKLKLDALHVESFKTSSAQELKGGSYSYITECNCVSVHVICRYPPTGTY